METPKPPSMARYRSIGGISLMSETSTSVHLFWAATTVDTTTLSLSLPPPTSHTFPIVFPCCLPLCLLLPPSIAGRSAHPSATPLPGTQSKTGMLMARLFAGMGAWCPQPAKMRHRPGAPRSSKCGVGCGRRPMKRSDEPLSCPFTMRDCILHQRNIAECLPWSGHPKQKVSATL